MLPSHKLQKQESYTSDQNYYYDDVDPYGEYQMDVEPILSQQNSLEGGSQGIVILTIDQVYNQLELVLENLQEVTPYNQDCLIEILSLFKWNKDKITETLHSSQQKEEEINQHLQSKGLLDSKLDSLKIYRQTSLKPQQYCPVCYEETDQSRRLYNLICEHQFCSDCWIGHISAYNQNKDPQIVCMFEKCKIRAPHSFIDKVTQQHPEVWEGYKRSLCKKFIEENKQMTCCPGLNCKYYVFVNDLSSKDVVCKCGEVFCFRCQDEIHKPSPCDMAKKWLNEVKKDEANIKWILVNTKTCPFCRKAVERSDGCNYMHCKPPGGCNKAFCYVCSQPWEPTHSDHFKCSVFKPDNEKQLKLNAEKLFLETYNFYFERFVNSEGARKKTLERKKNLHLTLQILFDRLQITYQDSSFMEKSIKEVLDSRLVLKWSYCFSYYISASHEKSVKLFGDFQERFEWACEQLAVRNIRLFDLVDEINSGRNKKSHIEQIQTYRDLKESIHHFMNLCNKYKQNLLESVNSGDVFIEQTY